ncbi:tyrosine--tRNA ligase [Hyphomonas atlantica]|uniref:Tyrosine--tRNA ligase n=2 Tax=Hyphomonas atlantica TaxID=1280948 RepID=A0A059DYW8_9PROT|nr:tyrosine--tRNA ligase [Hyphomonas atlantica]KCZ59159.1 tyrosyl-tRNA synthetase [Hyphomonas atlantica]HBQ47527.1 tyrosine--tRNA ligase [Hyphomonas atlantica]
MSDYKSEFLKTLSDRGFIKQVTHPAEMDTYCQTGIPTAYIGYDATADSLHVGHLMQIMMLRHLQKAGGKPIVLIGGGTTKVGDPTDKEKSRPLLTDAQIAENMEGIKKAFLPFLTFGDGPTDAIMVNNDDWLGKLGYIEMLRNVGTYFTINTMVKQDTVARRLAAEQPYTFLEFNYLLMQSYDFLELFRRQNCRMQIGGSDQWGNIVGGVDLIHKSVGGEAYGLTAHLITTSSGGKMGKTADGAVWLNADRKSPYEYWQFWRNTEDADVGRFLRLFTELPLEEIARLEALEGADINTAKIVLANETTRMLHGEAAAKEAEAAASAVFAAGGSAEALPTVEIPTSELEAGMLVAAAFAAAGLTESNGEARRLIKQGAAKVNDAPVSDQNASISAADIIDGAIKLSAGKKRHALVKPI